MDILRALLAVLLLVSLPASSLEQEVGDCPIKPDPGFRSTVVDAVCEFKQRTNIGVSFRAETRENHNETEKTDNNDGYAPMALFDISPSLVGCDSSCSDVHPENVTWCVRIAHTNRSIETCISLDDDQQPVYKSTCDAELLQLEKHLFIPVEDDICDFYGSGCLGLINMDWIFKDAYLTCIVQTDTCSDVSFARSLTRINTNKSPEITQITTSPLRVQPSERIVIHVATTANTPTVFFSWHHDNTTYRQHIRENPFCQSDITLECPTDAHPKAPDLKKQRVISYLSEVTVLPGCLGSRVTNFDSYLIIENATANDAGTYVFNVTSQPQGEVFIVLREVNVTVECDESTFYETTCTHETIVVDKGKHTEWSCELDAPSNSSISVMLNKTVPLSSAELTGKDDLDTVCNKEPGAVYHVVENPDHVCYSRFTVRVVVCASSESVVGNYIVVWGSGNTSGRGVDLKLTPQALATSDGGNKGGVTPAAYVVPVVGLTIALVATGVILVVLMRRRKRKRAHAHLSQLQSPGPTSPDAALYKKRLESGQFSPVSVLSPQATNVAFNDPLEFPRNQLFVYTKKVLGEGSFGRVLQAKAEGIVPGMPDRNIVAIKTTKENATSVEIEELLAELDLMKNMEPHENILNLLGQCTTPGGPVCLIVEFARYGNLRDFLRQCEEVVLSLNHKPHIPRNRSRTGTFSSSSFSSTQPLIVRQDSSVFTPGSGGQRQFVFPFPSPPSLSTRNASSSSTGDSSSRQAAHHPNTAVPLAHSVAPIGHDYINTKGLVYMEDVHNFALQIACGLQHLASMQIVHCDLAARNVLIAEGFVLKIADFGLARDISGREMYKKNPRGKIPVKWTAPEALEHRLFTMKSDVWSYGVVLWELFTYGHTPYPNVHLGQSYEAIITYLKEGNRMAQPDSCSDSFYELMQKCWALDPDKRPTSVDIVASLTPLDGKCQLENTTTTETVEEDCKSNGVEANGTQHVDHV